jgi:hypothetical protein
MIKYKIIESYITDAMRWILEFIWNDETPSKQYSDLIRFFSPIKGQQIPKARTKIKGGFGEFGSDTNPIPVNGVIGEFMYLGRLRTKQKGYHYFFHRLGAFKSSKLKAIIDIYELASMDGREWHQICLCPYYPRRSLATPPYAKLYPWRRMSRIKRFMSKFDMGVNKRVENFPYELPDAIKKSFFHNLLGGQNVTHLATKAEEIIKTFKDDYEVSKKNYQDSDNDYFLKVFMDREVMEVATDDNISIVPDKSSKAKEPSATGGINEKK